LFKEIASWFHQFLLRSLTVALHDEVCNPKLFLFILILTDWMMSFIDPTYIVGFVAKVVFHIQLNSTSSIIAIIRRIKRKCDDGRWPQHFLARPHKCIALEPSLSIYWGFFIFCSRYDY
jgi:hypothetical protein